MVKRHAELQIDDADLRARCGAQAGSCCSGTVGAYPPAEYFCKTQLSQANLTTQQVTQRVRAECWRQRMLWQRLEPAEAQANLKLARIEQDGLESYLPRALCQHSSGMRMTGRHCHCPCVIAAPAGSGAQLTQAQATLRNTIPQLLPRGSETIAKPAPMLQ